MLSIIGVLREEEFPSSGEKKQSVLWEEELSSLGEEKRKLFGRNIWASFEEKISFEALKGVQV